jgi:hypothetical protein
VKKELRPVHDLVSCDVCGRTILKGERTEAFLAPDTQRNVVCELCFVRAEHAGWIRESAADQQPTRGHRPLERRPLLGRLRRRREDVLNGSRQPRETDVFAESEQDAASAGTETPTFEVAPSRASPRRAVPQDPRHVRAVPTTAEVKVQRALELFNGSEHQRTVAGLTRTLGYPWATALPDSLAPSAVTVIVAWELSWYRYRVDLGDAAEPVALQEKGDELNDIDEALRQWNAAMDAEGRLVVEEAGG